MDYSGMTTVWDNLEARELPLSIPALISEYGSIRRLTHCYWTRRFESKIERFIEENIKPDVLVGYKPVQVETAPSINLDRKYCPNCTDPTLFPFLRIGSLGEHCSNCKEFIYWLVEK